VPAVNNHGGFGRWQYLEITDPTTAKADLKAAFQILYDGTVLVSMRGGSAHGAR
jgi:type III restriction enzyme